MEHYISKGRAIYEDENHGLFSKKLAEYAISKMRTEDVNGMPKPIIARKLDDVKDVFKQYGIVIQDEFCYTAWYLFNMAVADYPKTLTTDEQRAMFVEETIGDPDGMPENVLDCFAVKMRNAGVPIFWEEVL